LSMSPANSQQVNVCKGPNVPCLHLRTRPVARNPKVQTMLETAATSFSNVVITIGKVWVPFGFCGVVFFVVFYLGVFLVWVWLLL